jgi:hypothetical protein
MATPSTGKVLVYGGRGALGSAVIDFFKKANWVKMICLLCCALG